MKSFTDGTGTTWNLVITIGAIKRVRELTDFDLYGVFSEANLTRLGNDVVLLADILCALTRPQAESLGITDEQFAERLHDDTIEKAQQALLDELIDFFPNRQRRENLRGMLAAAERVTASQQTMIGQEIADGSLEKAIAEQFQRRGKSGGQSGEPPGSSESPASTI